MELTDIILVSLAITAVSSTPHGYGVKGGAIAKSGAVAGAGALAFPGGGPDFGGAFGSSGSFAKSSAASFASASAGSFSYGGNAGFGGSTPGVSFGQQGQYDGLNGDKSVGGRQTGAAAGASAGAFAGALAGAGEQETGSSGPCSGNCPSSAQIKPIEPFDCQGAACGQNSQTPKCSGSYCSTGSSPDSLHNQAPDHSGHETDLHRNSLPAGVQPLDGNDRPGKIENPGSNVGPYSTYGHGGSLKPQNSQKASPPNPSTQCTSPHCSNSEPSHSKPCSTPNCGNPSEPAPCTSPNCEQSSSDSGSSSSNAVAGAKADASAGQYGKSDQVNPSYSRTPILNPKPSHPSGGEKPQYSGSFGGPPGILKPNDYTVPEKPGYSPIHHDTPSYDSAPTGTHLGPHGGVPSLPAIYEQPPNLHRPSYPSIPSSPSTVYVPPSKDQKPTTFGKPSSSSFIGSGAFAGAHAGASAGTYTGGFGGPPGILKPNDFSLHGSKPGNTNAPHGSSGYVSGPQQSHHQPKPDFSGKPSTGYPSISHDEEPYQGGFGGPPGVVRPNGPLGTGTFPNTQPQNSPQHYYPGKPSLACGPGSGCGSDGSYHGGFGGAPGILRPTGPENTGPVYPSEHAHSKPIETPGCTSGAGCSSSGSYQGGFGGASGTIHPQDKLDTSSPQHNLAISPGAGCASGSVNGCSGEGAHHGDLGGTPGVNHPQDKLDSSIPQHTYTGSPGTGCASGSGPGCGGEGAYHGVFGGALGISQPQDKPESSRPQHDIPSSSGSGCGSGSGPGCGTQGAYHGGFGGAPGVIHPQDKLEPSGPQHHFPNSGAPGGAGCASGFGPGCGNDGAYHGGFGGAPGVIRPTGGQYHGQAEGALNHQNYPAKPTSSYSNYDQVGHGSSSSGPGPSGAGAGAFAGAAAGATAGSIAGYGGPGEYSGQGGYGSQGDYVSDGGYGQTKNSFPTKGCGAGCGAGGNAKGGIDLTTFGLSLAGAAAKSGAAAFSLGGAGALDVAGALAGAGATAGAGAGAGAGGLNGGFSGAQASATASAKSYGGYH